MKILNLNEMETIHGGSCGRAVIGSLVATGILAGVIIGSGGIGLAAAVGFFATKSWATYNIIAACRY